MNEQSVIGSAKIGAAGGIVTSLLISITATDILKTALMACIGTIVSFLISMILKMLFSKWSK